MGESRVTDDSDRGELAGICGTLSHSDGSSHIDASIDGIERFKETESIASDIAEHLGGLELFEGIIEGTINIAVAATLAEHGWASHDGVGSLMTRIIDGTIDRRHQLAESLRHEVGIEFTIADHMSGELAINLLARAIEAD